jgi:tRNA-(ms[2]io[6]A)-hydroxylase
MSRTPGTTSGDGDAIRRLLRAATPTAWFDAAAADVATLLIDHANCEKKAASTALGLLYRHVDQPMLLHRMSRLAREELRHFEQVLDVMASHGIRYVPLPPGRYAGALMARVRRTEPWRLADTLLVGAVVEARSWERFDRLAERLPEDLAALYRGLQASEARHFRHYLELARQCAPGDVDAKLGELLDLDAALATAPDVELRFLSGPPSTQDGGRVAFEREAAKVQR